VSADWLPIALKVAITLWLIMVSVWDRLTRRVPNWLVLPVMLAALVWQAYLQITGRAYDLLFAVTAWVVLFMLWRAHVFGGGDAKFLMALFAMFPKMQFLILFCIVVLATRVPMLVVKYARMGLPSLWRSLRRQPGDPQLLPTAERLVAEGQQHCWALALPGVIYLWWVL
jgi:Flp pilus assembly protein protease CpaA